mmetsp:Transcript_80636/g.121202  ORF Transcript_80636/g.121202 Transcript_80636/m.121202 type:complete len:211 (-) Transcript_80636:367-999(-)
MARCSLSNAHYDSRVFDSVFGFDVGATSFGSQTIDSVCEGSFGSQGVDAIEFQRGKTGVQGKDRRRLQGYCRFVVFVPLLDDSVGTFGQYLQIFTAQVLYHFVVVVRPSRSDTFDRGDYGRDAKGWNQVSRSMFDSFGVGEYGTGLCASVDLSAAKGYGQADIDDWARNGDCSDAGVVARTAASEIGAKEKNWKEYFVLWMQKEIVGLLV